MAISASTTYEVLPLEDITLAVEVAGNSTANKANARLWSRNGSNAQKWVFVSEGTADVWYIKDAETGKCMEVYGGVANDRNGGNVSMYTSNNSVAQKWKAERIGTQEVNGTAYETYQFIAFGGTTSTPRCIDVEGDGAYVRSNIRIWGRSVGHPSQTFALVPTEWNAVGGTGNNQTVLPVPSRGAVGSSVGTPLAPVAARSDGTIVVPMDSGSLYPAWTCEYGLYQVRYRTCGRRRNETAFGDWTDWKSIDNNSTFFNGYGTPGAYNCQPMSLDGVKWCQRGVPVNNMQEYDLTRVQFNVRAWVADWGVGSTASAHGGELSITVDSVASVSLDTPTATMTPDGLRIGWSTNWTRGGNTVTATSDIFTVANTVGEASGDVLVPITSLSRVPNDGDVIQLDMTFTTSDGNEARYSGTVEVAYATGHSDTLSLTAVTSGTIAYVTPSVETASLWLVVPRGHGNRFVKLDGDGQFMVPPPLNVPWTIYAAVETDGGWVSTSRTFDPLESKNYHVTSQDMGTDLPVIGGVNSPQTFHPSYSREHESAATYNRERSVNVLGRVTDASWTFKGAALPETFDLCDWAIHAGHAYFRAPNGFWAQVAIVGGSMDYTFREYSEIELSCIEEVW